MATEKEERLKKLDEKMAQLKAQRHAILVRENNIARKKRNHKLIQHGAMVEQYFDCRGIETEEFEKFLKQLVSMQEVKEFMINFKLGQPQERIWNISDTDSTEEKETENIETKDNSMYTEDGRLIWDMSKDKLFHA